MNWFSDQCFFLCKSFKILRFYTRALSESIDEKTAKRIGFDYALALNEALKKALDEQGSNAKIVVMKHAPDLLPIIKK